MSFIIIIIKSLFLIKYFHLYIYLFIYLFNRNVANRGKKCNVLALSCFHLIESMHALTSRSQSITYYWGIFIVTTVLDAPSSMPTIANWSFVALTIYIIQPNWTTSSPKSGRPWSTNSARIPELTANNTCIIYIPVIITNRSPLVIIKHFDSSFWAPRSSDQSQSWNNFQENVHS